MKITDEAVEAAINAAISIDSRGFKDQMRAALEAALPHLSQGAVSAKQLEWKVSGLRMFVADTEIGQYAIARDPYSAGGYFNLWMAGADEDTSSEYPSLPDAEAAAQADYERRTLSPAPIGVTDDNRLPTRTEAANAAKILLRCNGFDLDRWGGGDLMDDFSMDALKALASHEPARTDIDKLGAALDTQIDVAERSAKEWRDRATSITTDTQEGLSEAGGVVGWMDLHQNFWLTKEVAEKYDAVPLVRQSALTACQQEVERLRAENAALSADGIAGRKAAGRNAARAETAEARNAELQQEVETLRLGIKEIAEREQGIRDNWVRHEESTKARILELEADLEVANDLIRKKDEALRNIRELNFTRPGADGLRWARSDLIEQEIVFGLGGKSNE